MSPKISEKISTMQILNVYYSRRGKRNSQKSSAPSSSTSASSSELESEEAEESRSSSEEAKKCSFSLLSVPGESDEAKEMHPMLTLAEINIKDATHIAIKSITGIEAMQYIIN